MHPCSRQTERQKQRKITRTTNQANHILPLGKKIHRVLGRRGESRLLVHCLLKTMFFEEKRQAYFSTLSRDDFGVCEVLCHENEERLGFKRLADKEQLEHLQLLHFTERSTDRGFW